MSLTPYWLRYLRNVAFRDPLVRVLEDPFLVFAKDPFFRDPIKYINQAPATSKNEHHGVEGVYSNSEVKIDEKKVEVQLDVQNFTPDQIQVKTVGNEITVEGKKEIKRDDGWTRSHFERRFLFPKGFPPERVECHLEKGKLKLIAFRSASSEERNIPIQDNSGSIMSDKS